MSDCVVVCISKYLISFFTGPGSPLISAAQVWTRSQAPSHIRSLAQRAPPPPPSSCSKQIHDPCLLTSTKSKQIKSNHIRPLIIRERCRTPSSCLRY